MKAKKVLSTFLLFAVALVPLGGMTVFAEEIDWTAANITISTETEIQTFANKVKKGNAFEGVTITLAENITLSNEWTPIGGAARSNKTVGSGYAFKGIFDGNNKKIINLTITGESYTENVCVGLFGALDGATVKDLILENININVPNNDCAGGVAGLAIGNTTISDVTVNGSLKAAESSGGIIGRMISEGHIIDCINNATISGGGKIGGIVGGAYYQKTNTGLSIDGCINNGAVNSTAGYVGGITGLSAAEITDCINTATVTGNSNSLGGIVGECTGNGLVNGCKNSGVVTNNSSAYGTGGIVGWVRYNDSTNYTHEVISVTNNINTANISGGNDSGGIVGTVYNAANVTDNENRAVSISSVNFAAGIVANIQHISTNGFYDNPVITIANNVSNTSYDNITGIYRSLYAYDNMQSNDLTENAPEWAASIGTKRYATLQGAIDAAGNGDTVKVITGITLTEPITITSDDNIILDLNDCTVSYESTVAGEAMITNNGELTITDNVGDGVLIYTYTGEADTSFGKGNYTINNYGRLEVAGGTVKNATEQKTHAYYAITNYEADLNISGGAVICDTNRAIRLFGGNNTMTVTDGIVKGTMAVYLQSPGSDTAAAPTITLNINGGTLIATDAQYDIALYSYSYGNSLENVVINVSGGRFDGDIALAGGKNKNASEKVTITGGAFIGTYGGVYSYAEDDVAVPGITIKGGTFTNNNAEKYAEDDGYGFVQNGDGTYGVLEVKGDWITASDAGFYYVGNTKYGMMRFLFKTSITSTVTEVGIKYINGSNIGDNATGENALGAVPITVTGNTKIFYGDIVNIPENISEGRYYAAAYVKTEDGKTHWSDIVECSINWTQEFTDYQPAGGAE